MLTDFEIKEMSTQLFKALSLLKRIKRGWTGREGIDGIKVSPTAKDILRSFSSKLNVTLGPAAQRFREIIAVKDRGRITSIMFLRIILPFSVIKKTSLNIDYIYTSLRYE